MRRSPSSAQFVCLSSTLVVTFGLSLLMACAPGRQNAPTGGNGGDQTSSGGAGASGTGGTGGQASGGSGPTGGVAGSGGTVASGGDGGSGGVSGGSSGGGGAGGSGGTSATGGSGGTKATGGNTGGGGAGGTSATGGSGGLSGTGGTTRKGPCDIYDAAGFPCVAAHSTVRALYGAYTGPLYQVRKGGSTKDIPVGADGYVKISEQDSFCAGGTCTISIIYDQSPNKNDLPKTPDTLWLKSNKANEAFATDGKLTIAGHTAYGVYVNNTFAHTRDVGYRNNNCKNVAKGDEPEAMYAVLDGKRYSQWCCFDYGNVTTTGDADGPGTMEAIYWGNSTQFAKGGAGSGPWVLADLEFGMFGCDNPNAVCTTNTTITADYVTTMLKGPSGNEFGLKGGNAQSGKLTTLWQGKRPPKNQGMDYAPKRLGGQIVLGLGGDGSNTGVGTFWEGAMTKGNPPDSVDDEVQANIVAAGYGK